MTLKEISRLVAAGQAPAVEIHSVDPMLYVLFARRDDALDPIADARGKSLIFRSRFAARRALSRTGLAEAAFVHRSSYGEMIGMEDRPNELREIVDLRNLQDA